ncbi:PREDICTED: uncharacterized protein K02A2.6-like [Vollenhovia emeryi]|uniref:uncharacterized protein K02A2.6-like n=1 Tax=Vollenhovia emeryi TaxID=411798 RepID=UPI0005F3BCBC|nr:PREDICTED: uncharacterized protein K02A2.6-like [Vollenhovia emeryi]
MANTTSQLETLMAAVNSLLQLQLNRQEEKREDPARPHSPSQIEIFNHLSARVEKYSYGSGDEIKPFEKWLLRYEYTIVTETSCLPAEMRTRLVLDKLGQTEFDRLVDHVAPTVPSQLSLEDLLSKLKELFRDKVPLTRRRIEILNYRYDKAVPISEHIDRINRHAADFDRSKLTDDSLRTLLLLQSFCYSSDNDQLKKIALRVIEKNQDASLKDVVAELEAYMNVTSGMKTLENPSKPPQTTVLSITQSKDNPRKQKISKDKSSPKTSPQPATKNKCNGCGGSHPRAKCTFRDAECYKCSKKGHIAKMCRSNTEDSKTQLQIKNVAIQALSAVGKRRRHYITASLIGKSVNLQYDTGSDITIIGKNEWLRIGSPKLITSDIVEHAGGSALEIIGKFYSTITALGRRGKIYVHVASRDDINLFGLNAIDNLNFWNVPLSKLHPGSSTSNKQHAKLSKLIVSTTEKDVTSPHDAYLEDALARFPSLFAEELGTCHNFKVKFNLADNAQPVQNSCRQIAFAMETLLEEELKRLESLDIIERVEASSWTSPIVIVKKRNGKIRLCADYSTGVNRALVDNKHPLPIMEMIDEDHREVTTITTPKGLYRFKRLPFGIKTAPAIFQQAMDVTISGLEGVYAYLDDVVVTGSTPEEIKYLGLIVNARGISPDPETTSAIVNMPNPTSVSEVQSFLGMINHYGKFIPHLHEMKQPLEELTRKNHHWSWNRKHDSVMKKIKEVMLSPLLLEHYDPSKTLVVAADACATGVGGVLLQRDAQGYERAVYHMSQSLTDAQRNYSQLEKEALALVTAVERFHKFIWGRRFILQTDHKPLVALLQTENTKGLKPTTAARLKRWALRLLGYDFKIEYIRTQDFGQADALSRLIDKFRRDNAEELQELRNKLKTASKEDPFLRSVFNAIKEGWKTTKNPSPLDYFRKRSEELSIVDDTLLLGDRIVVPKKLQPTILAALHKGHPGIRRTKQLAREYVFWPKMSEDIERLIRQCEPCALNQKLPVKVPLEPWPVPSRPMERVHLDFAGPIDGQYLLIFVDAYSKFLEVAITPTISARRTVDLCHEIFARNGPPDIVVTDHGTQFTSELFKSFCKDMQTTHILTSVNHPQSNGQAERMVDTVKRAIAKNPSNWKQQLFDFLYSYRYTPCSAAPEGKSPAELFFGRRMNTPFTKWLPTPKSSRPTATTPTVSKQQAMQKQFSKHHGARPRSLAVGDRVVVLKGKDKRVQGTIHGVLSKIRYSVRLDNGKIVDRHINHIWKGGSDSPIQPQEAGDDWTLLETQIPQPGSPTDPALSEPSLSTSLSTVELSSNSPGIQSPADQDPGPAITEATPARPIRNRAPPRRLILDPAAKSYIER